MGWYEDHQEAVAQLKARWAANTRMYVIQMAILLIGVPLAVFGVPWLIKVIRLAML